MSGWSDLTSSIYPNRTLNEQSAAVLIGSGDTLGRPGTDMKRLQQAYLDDDFDPVLGLAPPRSPLTYADALNANRPAILLANGWLDGWLDGIFPPGRLPGLYDRLTGPKRLMLQPGDHGTAEGTGAVGLRNDVWAATGRWFDHYLKGADNGIDREAPIQIRAANGGGWRGFARWSALGPRTRTYHLGRKERLSTAAPVHEPAAGRLRLLHAGIGTVAESGVVEGSGLAEQAGIYMKARMSKVRRRNGAVWSGPALTRATTIGGVPSLRLTVTPGAANASIFAYLYDVDRRGTGLLVTYAPYTLRGVRPGLPCDVAMDLQPTRWKVARGHRLALVIDTVDARFRSTSKLGTTITLGTAASAPATLTIPFG